MMTTKWEKTYINAAHLPIFISYLVLLQIPSLIMQLFVILSAVLALALAAPQDHSRNAVILQQSSDVSPEGFNYQSETSDHILLQAQGGLKNIGTENEALETRGSYSYVGVDGVTYTVNYVANENGFQPEGAHLPKV